MRALILSLLVLVCAGIAFPSYADTDADPPLPQPASPGSNAVGACLDADQVWLFVVDVDAAVLSNQCVGTPSTGEQALRDAGVAIGYGKKDLICTLDGRPERCPSNFDGSFWNYHHATPGRDWVFSNLGAASYAPEPGSVEAWCYNEPGETRCTPPQLRIVIDGGVIAPPGVDEDELVDPAPVVRPPLPPAPPMPASTLLSLAGILVLLGAVLVFARRRRSGSPEPELPGR